MSKLNTFFRLLSDPHKFCVACFNNILRTGGLNVLSERNYLQIAYFINHLTKLNLDNPTTFTEKLQWLKLYNRRKEYTTMVDKYAVKQYVANIIGDMYIIPTLGVWEKFDDIDFDLLPNQFVLKTTHGGGGNGIVISKDKSQLDKQKAKSVIEKSLNEDIYKLLKEWPYKDVPKRIIAEKYMAPVNPTSEGLSDYKFFCFNGKVKFFKIDFGRFTEHHANYYSPDGHILDFGEEDFPRDPDHKIELPENLPTMITLAEKLSNEIPFLRVDFYNIDGQIYFGELTFYPSSGFGRWTKKEHDEEIGQYLILPSI